MKLTPLSVCLSLCPCVSRSVRPYGVFWFFLQNVSKELHNFCMIVEDNRVHRLRLGMIVKSLENLEKSGNKVLVRENLEKLGNFTERAKNVIENNAFSH